MSSGLPTIGLNSMLKGGTRHLSGMEEAVFQNIEAAHELSKMMRTSMGPNGMFKMVLNHLEKLFVSKQAGTLVNQLEVRHPAAKVLVMHAHNQALEFGDGTNFVITLAGELLNQARLLLQQGIVAQDLVSGYETARNLIIEELPKLVAWEVPEPASPADLRKAIHSALCAKQYGNEEILSELVSEACALVMPDDQHRFNPESVRICKIPGRSVEDSFVVRGYVLPKLPKGTINKMEACKVAVYGCPIEVESTDTKGTVLIQSAEELTAFSTGEERRLDEKIAKIRAAGVNVLVAQNNISELALHFLDKHGILAIKIPSKFEVRRFAKSVGAQLHTTFRLPVPQKLGSCDEIVVEEIGDQRITIARDTPREGARGISTIVMRAATQNVLNDLAAAANNGLNVAKACLADRRCLPGAGAVELELAQRLRAAASKITSLEQYAVDAFADAIEVVPRVLTETSGLPTDRVMTALVSAHQSGRTTAGINIEAGSADEWEIDAISAGIVDSLAIKDWAIRMAVEAANTVLKVDQVIMRKQAGGPRAPTQKGQSEWN